VSVFRMLGLDLVPRCDNEQVEADKISPVELYRLHQRSTVSSQEASVSADCLVCTILIHLSNDIENVELSMIGANGNSSSTFLNEW